MQAIPGVVEFSAAVRSCMIEYDQRVISLTSLLSLLGDIETHLPPVRTPHSLAYTQLSSFPGLHNGLSGEALSFCPRPELRLISRADLYSQPG